MNTAIALSALLFSSAVTGTTFDCEEGELDWECASRELTQVEAELNATYRSVLRRLADSEIPEERESRELLVAAQRLWVTFREADCDAYEALQSAGTSDAAFAASCRTDHARLRIEQLNQFAPP